MLCNTKKKHPQQLTFYLYEIRPNNMPKNAYKYEDMATLQDRAL